MSTKSPVFPTLEPHHFSDYGFDPQLDYFQVLEEARKHKRDTTTTIRSIDTLHFKLQKPISKNDANKKSSKLKRRQWWWKNALLFFKSKWAAQHTKPSPLDFPHHHHNNRSGGSISGPIYLTDSVSGSESASPCRASKGPTSGPLAGNTTPSKIGDLEIPYISLKDLNMDPHPPPHVIASTPMPIYLVT